MRNRARIPLSKAKVRQSWSKYNLYNLSRIATPPYKTRTVFQQKWSAKSILRAYHSEQVREGMWERMFSRRLRSVVPMNPEYLAMNDGSLESAGRGSGLETLFAKRHPKAIPYMQMTFAPLERRLDTAIFRALFASSARQARQFVVHGAVKVNGKKMKYPGYLLNPGDMFQVDPERVMFATGAPKGLPDVSSPDDRAVSRSEDKEGAAPLENQTEESDKDEDEDAEEEEEKEEDPREVLKSLLAQAKSVISSPKGGKLSAKQKQNLRGFAKQVKRQLSRRDSTTSKSHDLETQFEELKAKLLRQPNLPASKPEDSSSSPNEDEDGEKKEESTTTLSISPPQLNSAKEEDYYDDSMLDPEDLTALRAALARLHLNPIDPTKPYATPWTPRPYMSAFAFIPPFLEVNQNICAAVYLRHPVARPGMAEVPTPFAQVTGGDAFAWYLRRR
ncbi:hypothetical protein EPUS_02684 [Endocarpon pusillum Z07020]|uniref:Small ribosomal subunit protein uS4m n=1 Tax=Endocarpon pusillum (strain Z07020 / HMAS-L-300199) TaxID=1263415 RepID=U1GXV9_ENDPU|nr:uncharacterized protein EPUS_02684 [Endocarpon pusillum Z07020]ERF76971.1 hypothetical protein EPUS_02684 [Endocarpon pusillum Z07020]